MAQQREHWGSKIGFILAAAGSAIGLGNIWKFPYITGENGGAAFIFVYLICIALIGLPVLVAEILIGRTTEKNPVGAFKKLSGSNFWSAIGGLGVITGFLILSYYAVVAGWSFGYIVEAIKGSFFEFEEATEASGHFGGLVSSVWWILGFHLAFMLICIFIVYAGVQKGIERGSKILMPALLILLIVLMIRGITLPGAGEGLEFLFNPDWSKINAMTILSALGHAFFTLSLGMGAMMTYGSYMSKKDNLPSAAVQIVILDTLIALIAGTMIFTAVFATGQNPASGPGLIFHTIPVVFTKMPGGYFFSILFFILLTIAAITSAISLLEVITAYFVDEMGWARHRVVVIFGLVTFLVGVPSSLSFNAMSDVTIFGLTVFDLVDYISANILLPLGGLFIAVFVAWVWGLNNAVTNLKEGAEKMFQKHQWRISIWKFLVRYVAPILIFLVFLNSLGVI